MNDVRDDKFWDLTAYVDADKARKAVERPDEGRTPERDVPLRGIDDKFVPYKRADAYTAAPISSQAKEKTALEYVPRSKMFIMNVALSKSSAKSASDFEKKTKELRERQGRETPFVDFYAPLPVYYNLNPQACEYYLWWRDSFVRGVPLVTNWSYISLYLSELINCDDRDVNETVILMWRLFEVYSDKGSALYVPEVATRLPEIICDYSLINNIGIPGEISEKAICSAAKGARFREFFFDVEHPASTMMLLCELCSEYDYDQSKFSSKITVSNAKAYIYGAIKYCSDKALAEKYDHPFSGSFRERTTITRFSYSNFIFVLPKYTYVLRVDFCSVNRSYILRNTITGIIKQCENRLRVHSGIKAKLRVFSLEAYFRDAVDEYLDASLPKVKQYKPEKKKPEPEYERLYEREQTEFSLDNARKIEARSWSVTERLLEGMDEYAPSIDKNGDQNAESIKVNDEKFGPKDYIGLAFPTEEQPSGAFGDELSEIASLIPDMKEFLLALYLKDYAVMLRESDRIGIPISLIVDRINEAAFDVIGDTLIEEAEDGYEIISDYMQLFDGVEG